VSEGPENAELIDELVFEADKEGDTKPAWHRHVALSSLVLSLLAAMGALFAGMSAHEALVERTEEIMDVSRLQADRISIEILENRHRLLEAMEEEVSAEEARKVQEYREHAGDMRLEAQHLEAVVESSMHAHLLLAICVTLLSVGITLGGMAIILETRVLWLSGLVLGAGGGMGVIYGIALML